LGSFERRLISERTKEALAAKEGERGQALSAADSPAVGGAPHKATTRSGAFTPGDC
jgi:hypothetical protein